MYKSASRRRRRGGAGGGPALVDLGLAHYWPFDEGAGQAAADAVGSEDFELGSTPEADTNDPVWTAQGLFFETDAYLENPDFVPPAATWSVEFLVKLAAAVTPSQGIINWLHSATANILRLQDAGGGFFSVIIWSVNLGFMTAALPIGAWTHIVVTYDGVTGRVYRDGVLDLSGAIAADAHVVPYLLNLGRRIQPGTNYLDGEIARPRIYQGKVLTLAEVEQNYAAFQGMGYALP